MQATTDGAGKFEFERQLHPLVIRAMNADETAGFQRNTLVRGTEYTLNVTVVEDSWWKSVGTVTPKSGDVIDLGDMELERLHLS